ETAKTIALAFAVTDDPIAGDATSKAITTKAAITIALNDLNEAPVIDAKLVATPSFSIKENNKVGATVGTVKAKDADSKAAPKQTLTFSLVSVVDATNTDASALFAIDPVKGTITALQSLDYEASDHYTAVVRVTDNGDDHLLTGNLHTD